MLSPLNCRRVATCHQFIDFGSHIAESSAETGEKCAILECENRRNQQCQERKACEIFSYALSVLVVNELENPRFERIHLSNPPIILPEQNITRTAKCREVYTYRNRSKKRRPLLDNAAPARIRGTPTVANTKQINEHTR